MSRVHVRQETLYVIMKSLTEGLKSSHKFFIVSVTRHCRSDKCKYEDFIGKSQRFRDLKVRTRKPFLVIFCILQIMRPSSRCTNTFGKKWHINSCYLLLLQKFSKYLPQSCSFLLLQSLTLGWARKYRWFCEPVDYSNTLEAYLVSHGTSFTTNNLLHSSHAKYYDNRI